MTTLYGIANCDTIKKTRLWLSEHGVEYRFHDYKKLGIDEALCRTLIEAVPFETLINKRGTTWRGLPEETRTALNEHNAVALMLALPSVIRRPLIHHAGHWLTSADPEVLSTLLPHS